MNVIENTLIYSLQWTPSHGKVSKKMANSHYLNKPLETEALLERLCPPVRNWFKDKFPDFTRPQKLAIPAHAHHVPGWGLGWGLGWGHCKNTSIVIIIIYVENK